MQKVVSDVIQFRGSHYDFGFYQGKQLASSPILKIRRKQLEKQANRHFIINEEKVRNVFQRFSPEIWEELIGLRDALELTTKEAIREFGGYYLEYRKSGCSNFLGNTFMIRNYDSDPAGYEGRYVLFAPTDLGYATIGPSMQITGRTDGMNEKGLSMGYNFVNRLRSGDGFVCNMIERIVLENAATVEEAVDLLKELPHRHSFNYTLIDRTGKTIVVEATNKRVVAREETVCTNHFETLTEENRFRMDDSLTRYEAMRAKEDSIETTYDAFRLLNESEQGVFSKKYGAWAGTLHTAAYLPTELQAWISFGNDRLPFIINFQNWLAGEDLRVKQIKGELDSTKGFINRKVDS
jgi:predicted choloylglycine hydrolase